MTPDEIARFNALKSEYDALGRDMCALIRSGIDSVDAAKGLPGGVLRKLDADAVILLRAAERLDQIKREALKLGGDLERLVDPVIGGELTALESRFDRALDTAEALEHQRGLN